MKFKFLNNKQRKTAADPPLDNGQILDCPILRTKTEAICYQQHHPQYLEQEETGKTDIKSLKEKGEWHLLFGMVWCGLKRKVQTHCSNILQMFPVLA